VFLIVFMWNLYKCKCWLIIEVILENAQCNNKIYTGIRLVPQNSLENQQSTKSYGREAFNTSYCRYQVRHLMLHIFLATNRLRQT